MDSDLCINGDERKAWRRGLCRPCLRAAPRASSPPGTTEKVTVRVPVGEGEKVQAYAAELRKRAGLVG